MVFSIIESTNNSFRRLRLEELLDDWSLGRWPRLSHSAPLALLSRSSFKLSL